jgi:hypothetical protein
MPVSAVIHLVKNKSKPVSGANRLGFFGHIVGNWFLSIIGGIIKYIVQQVSFAEDSQHFILIINNKKCAYILVDHDIKGLRNGSGGMKDDCGLWFYNTHWIFHQASFNPIVSHGNIEGGKVELAVGAGIDTWVISFVAMGADHGLFHREGVGALKV